ncbi:MULTISPECIES: hypothetical protein [unclassified Pseudomonas]|uniref:hypothetical protein n=1 Tax=unclassified Pseudomonas TaxID=196821 RepID=UPI0021157C27|nr:MULTISPECIES: hypothetical protein [unclassified Pseudomonas]
MKKICAVCESVIEKNSKQWAVQKYCSAKCRKIDNRKKKSRLTRLDQKRSNLRQNDEMLYLVRQCRNAGTVQILQGHTLESFIKTMDLVRNRPAGKVHLCHIAPVKGQGFIGLFHHLNLFYGGAYQNYKFRNAYIAGGLLIENEKLLSKWCVGDVTSNNDILIKIEEYLGDIISEYIQCTPVRKSKKVQVALKILMLDDSLEFDDLLHSSYTSLLEQWSDLSSQSCSFAPECRESKYLAYMDSISRFISVDSKRSKNLKKLRLIMYIGYMALSRVEKSKTYNKYFYVKYEYLMVEKYGQAMLKDPHDWRSFKDVLYDAAFEALQGGMPDIKKLNRKVMSYLDFPERAYFVSGDI